MTDDDTDGVPDSDPRHIDPAGDLADLVESGEFDIELEDDQDVDELREFIERAEARSSAPIPASRRRFGSHGRSSRTLTTTLRD
ncbi:hypothetical protein ACFQL0_22510 [Haloplanus litoreus]|uniref:hypothetical protein n=1 Tax=Haloplanus litoreus TaxID=767515 RepID=UPI00361A4254